MRDVELKVTCWPLDGIVETFVNSKAPDTAIPMDYEKDKIYAFAVGYACINTGYHFIPFDTCEQMYECKRELEKLHADYEESMKCFSISTV